MQKLKVNAHNDPVTSEILLALQLRAANEPLLPRLKSFECSAATEAFIPFIPLFLSPQTTNINIAFTEDSPPVAVASIISMLPTLCPNLQCVNMDRLGRDLAITSAVSEMLLTCNKGSLQNFYVDSPLTDEAREVVYRLPNLFGLWVVIEGRTLLPPVALPNLTDIDVQYDDHLDWLQGFREATLENLESVSFRSESIQIGDFLGAFESVALTMSAQNTLSVFRFYTSRSWNPYYSSLLSFKQLKELIIEFACDGGCSSKVNDNVITTLAQAMPKLEILQLGSTPCQTPTGATVYGLIALASRCPHLSKLRIHFRGDSLVSAAMDAATTPLPIKKTDLLREDCALVDLEVGDIPIPPRSNTRVVLMLLQIFPRILNVKYTNPGWKRVAESISDFRRMGAFVQAGEVHPVTTLDGI